MRIFEQIEVRWLLGSSVARILHSIAAQQYFHKAGLKELFLRKTTMRPRDGCDWLPERRKQKKTTVAAKPVSRKRKARTLLRAKARKSSRPHLLRH